MSETQDSMTQPLLVPSPHVNSCPAPETLSTDESCVEAAEAMRLAGECRLPYSSLEGEEPDANCVGLFPARILLRYEVLPLRRVDGSVELAIGGLAALDGINALRALTGKRLSPVIAPPSRIRHVLRHCLGVGADTLGTLDDQRGIQVVDELKEGDVDLDAAVEDASIIRFVNQVLSEAIALRTTDIHLEPFEDEMRIRYRIDGVLQEVPVPSQLKRYQPAIVSRIKILSRLDIAEKRLPQDGRIKLRVDKHDVDVRVSIIPMLYGEGVVMRLLRQDASLMHLDELGMGPREEGTFRDMLQLPHGIILVTGPTGSGKTTTLYSALNELNDSGRKIITIEDPVEYQIKGINHIQVVEKAGLTFARGLRSILRHDPDVVLVGEIRDAETAQIATQASLTGHLVFSTLHTNDAPGALVRLVDMGVEPYLVAASLEGVLAQRLVRVLCERCKTPDPLRAGHAWSERPPALREVVPFKPAGCGACRHTGYSGRRAIFELMRITDEIRDLLLARRSPSDLRNAALREEMRPLCDDGWRLVAEGVTTIDEVLRVTRDNQRGRAAAVA
ncbi:MAG: type II/IV secretion system protein [Candidatus Hydrogenedentes bacterium]|nr:type II/IV secretion system protein [Candidatus Hydrogenedentota bacterium]